MGMSLKFSDIKTIDYPTFKSMSLEDVCRLLGVPRGILLGGHTMSEERMMKWFEYAHLPAHLQVVSCKFYELAQGVCENIEPGPERTVCLRKLLEAKDAAVRAKLSPGG